MMKGYCKNNSGFTLVELIVVIVISGILSGVLMALIIQPIESYKRVAKRARLVDIASTAMHRMSIDVQAALPNSIRVGCGGKCVEFLRTVTGGKYDDLDVPEDTNNSFRVMGAGFDSLEQNLLSVNTGSNEEDCQFNNAYCIAINNTGEAGKNAWDMQTMKTLRQVLTPNIIKFVDEDAGSDDFPFQSDNGRFYIVDTPIKYICDEDRDADGSGDRQIWRYHSYEIVSTETNVDSHDELLNLPNNSVAASEAALLSSNIDNCSFAFIAGTDSQSGVLRISLTVKEEGDSELITLLHQVQVGNLY